MKLPFVYWRAESIEWLCSRPQGDHTDCKFHTLLGSDQVSKLILPLTCQYLSAVGIIIQAWSGIIQKLVIGKQASSSSDDWSRKWRLQLMQLMTKAKIELISYFGPLWKSVWDHHHNNDLSLTILTPNNHAQVFPDTISWFLWFSDILRTYLVAE